MKVSGVVDTSEWVKEIIDATDAREAEQIAIAIFVSGLSAAGAEMQKVISEVTIDRVNDLIQRGRMPS